MSHEFILLFLTYHIVIGLGSLVSEEPRLARKLLDPLVVIIKNTGRIVHSCTVLIVPTCCYLI